jgi:hypothetical protein
MLRTPGSRSPAPRVTIFCFIGELPNFSGSVQLHRWRKTRSIRRSFLDYFQIQPVICAKMRNHTSDQNKPHLQSARQALKTAGFVECSEGSAICEPSEQQCLR